MASSMRVDDILRAFYAANAIVLRARSHAYFHTHHAPLFATALYRGAADIDAAEPIRPMLSNKYHIATRCVMDKRV